LFFILFFSTNAFAEIPTGGAIYAFIGETSQLEKIDAVTLKKIKSIPIPGTGPVSLSNLTAAPSAQHLYAVRTSKGSGGAENYDVVVLNTQTDEFERSFSVPNKSTGRILGFIFTPDGKKLYMPLPEQYGVAVMDIASNRISGIINTAGPAFSVAMLPDGSRLYVGNFSASMSVIDTATDRVVSTIPAHTMGSTYNIKMSPDGKSLYVLGTSYGGKIHTALSVVDTGKNVVSRTSSVDGWASSMAVSPDGKKLYVGGTDTESALTEFLRHGVISIVDTEKGTVTSRVTDSSMLMLNNLALTKDGNRILVSTPSLSSNTNPVIFSLDPATDKITANISSWKSTAGNAASSGTSMAVVNKPCRN
jgi:YVTN family beta-propeller protein